MERLWTSRFWGSNLLSPRLSGQRSCKGYLIEPGAGCDTHFLSLLRYPCFRPGNKDCEEEHRTYCALEQLSPECSDIAGIICEAGVWELPGSACPGGYSNENK